MDSKVSRVIFGDDVNVYLDGGDGFKGLYMYIYIYMPKPNGTF